MDDGHLSGAHFAGSDLAATSSQPRPRSRRWGWLWGAGMLAVVVSVSQVVRSDLGSVGSLQVGECVQLVADSGASGNTGQWIAADHYLVNCRSNADRMVVTAMPTSVDQCSADAIGYVVRAFGRNGAVACLVPLLSAASCYAHDPVTGYRHVGCSDPAAVVRVDEIIPGQSAEACRSTDVAVIVPEQVADQAMAQCLVAP